MELLKNCRISMLPHLIKVHQGVDVPIEKICSGKSQIAGFLGVLVIDCLRLLNAIYVSNQLRMPNSISKDFDPMGINLHPPLREADSKYKSRILRYLLDHIDEPLFMAAHTTTFKFCRQAHLLDKLLMSKINLHISSNFFKLLCIGKRCFQPEVAKSSHIMCFMN